MSITLKKCNWNDTPEFVVELSTDGLETPVCVKVWNSHGRAPENTAITKSVARDIVARFNACEGLNTETLEMGVKLKGFVDEGIKRLEAEGKLADALNALQYARTVIETLSEKASSKADREYCQRILKEGNSIDAALQDNEEATGMITKMYFSVKKKLEKSKQDVETLSYLLFTTIKALDNHFTGTCDGTEIKTTLEAKAFLKTIKKQEPEGEEK